MTISTLHPLKFLLPLLMLGLGSNSSRAQSAWDEGWELTFSPYTIHFHPSDDHKPVVSIGLLKALEGNWNAGGSIFSNSFGQPSAYAFVGQRYVDPFGWDRWYLQWNIGVLYGYVGEYKDKVPYNFKGFSPGFVPSIGYKFTDSIYGELDLLGNSALMFTIVLPLPLRGF
jgi:hypothetical protein